MEEMTDLPQDDWIACDYAFAWFLAACDPATIHLDRERGFKGDERRYLNRARYQKQLRERKRNGTRDTGLVEGRA